LIITLKKFISSVFGDIFKWDITRFSSEENPTPTKPCALAMI